MLPISALFVLAKVNFFRTAHHYTNPPNFCYVKGFKDQDPDYLWTFFMAGDSGRVPGNNYS